MDKTQVKEVVADVDANSDLLAKYYSDLNFYLQFGVGSPPHFTDVSGNLKTDNLVTMSNNLINGSPSISTGAVSDLIHRVTGIQREADIVNMDKTALYLQMQSETADTSSNLVSDFARRKNYILGTTPEQT